jgi:hypothetical protein
MLEEIRVALLPFYLTIQFVHVLFMAVWFMSTAVAYTWFVQVAFLQSEKNPDDEELKRRKDWVLKQFDKGVSLEHIAFPLLLLTGILLYWLAAWEISLNWLGVKLLIVIFIFVPMEIMDYWLAHFGGNKSYLQKQGDRQRYEKIVRWHWQFLRKSTPIVATFIPVIIFLAVVKPF